MSYRVSTAEQTSSDRPARAACLFPPPPAVTAKRLSRLPLRHTAAVSVVDAHHSQIAEDHVGPSAGGQGKARFACAQAVQVRRRNLFQQRVHEDALGTQGHKVLTGLYELTALGEAYIDQEKVRSANASSPLSAVTCCNCRAKFAAAWAFTSRLSA